MPQEILFIFESVVPTGGLVIVHQAYRDPCRSNCRNSEEFEVGNGKKLPTSQTTPNSFCSVGQKCWSEW